MAVTRDWDAHWTAELADESSRELTLGMREPYTTALQRDFTAAGFFDAEECREEGKPVRYIGPRFLRNWWLRRVSYQRWRAHGKRIAARLANGERMCFLSNGRG